MPSLGPESGDELLRPREVADLMGVRTTTIARWARDGFLTPLLTPGGHRRYRRAEIIDLRKESDTDPVPQEIVDDAVRLYEQGWSIRQVAAKFDRSYGQMRRILKRHTTLRGRGGSRQ
jgi:excisionase family DNA binding protein